MNCPKCGLELYIEREYLEHCSVGDIIEYSCDCGFSVNPVALEYVEELKSGDIIERARDIYQHIVLNHSLIISMANSIYPGFMEFMNSFSWSNQDIESLLFAVAEYDCDRINAEGDEEELIEVEAIQYDGNNGMEIQRWTNGAATESPVLEPTDSNPTGAYLQIGLQHCEHIACVNDWVIKVNDGFYACNPKVFAETYKSKRQ